MKKLLAMVLALTLALGLTACGGEEAPAESAATTETPVEETTEETEEAEYTEEQLALAQEYSDMIDSYNAVVDLANGSEEFLANQEMVDLMNTITGQITEIDEMFADPSSLDATTMENIRAFIKSGNDFISSVEQFVGEAGTAVEALTIPVQIQNETGVDIYAMALSPANSEDWGENVISEAILDGETAVGELTFTADTLVWDVLIEDSEGTQCTFMGVDFSSASTEGAVLLLSVTDAGEYYAEIVQ